MNSNADLQSAWNWTKRPEEDTKGKKYKGKEMNNIKGTKGKIKYNVKID